MERALEIVLAGGILVYPTETLYALGGSGYSEEAAAKVSAVKGRPAAKPLPLIIGAREQLELVAEEISEGVLALAERFWPGPLSILVRARPEVAPPCRDRRGYTSVRFTAHPVAALLCRMARRPLIATSANRSGGQAPARPEKLDPELLEAADGSILTPPWPSGGAPSTVVEVVRDREIRVLRSGAVGLPALRAAGFLAPA